MRLKKTYTKRKAPWTCPKLKQKTLKASINHNSKIYANLKPQKIQHHIINVFNKTYS